MMATFGNGLVKMNEGNEALIKTGKSTITLSWLFNRR